MSSANPQILASGGGGPLGAVDFGTVDAASVSLTIPFEIWNSQGADDADDAREVTLNIASRPQGSSGWPATARPWTERWVRMRIVGAMGTADATVTGWSPVGMNRPFQVGVIPTNSAKLVEMELVVPAARTGSYDHELRLEWDSPSTALEAGHAVAGFHGVCSGIGDGDACALLAGGILAPTGTPDGNAVIGDLDYLWQGEPATLLASSFTLNTTAADGATAAGEAYWITISAGSAGLTLTKGNKGTTPLPTTTRPATPVGELLLGYLEKPFTGNVETADVVNAQAYGRFLLYGASGLSVQVGYGDAVADDCLVHYDKPSALTLPDSTTGGLLSLIGTSGLFDVQASGAPSDPRAEPLWRFSTSAGAITTLVDLRSSPSPRRAEIRFRFDGVLAVDQLVYRTAPAAGRLYLATPLPALAILDDLGTLSVSGRTAFSVEWWNGSSWTAAPVFASSPDRRPAVAFDAPDPRGFGSPVLTMFPPGSRFRARCTEIPTGGTAPPGAEVILFAELA